MNTLKSILLTAFLTVTLFGCSDEAATTKSDKAYKISGVFGLTLGEQGPNLPKGYIDDNKAFEFTPNPAHKNFETYTFAVTPNTQRIYGIKVKGAKAISSENCKEQRKELIKDTLATLGDTSTLSITDAHKWKIRENNEREVAIECERALNGNSRQLVMIYSDTPLSKLSFVEWSQHQDDITKPQ